MVQTKVILATDSGDVVLEVFDKTAPKTAAYFLDLIDRGAYDGACFYRATDSFANSSQKSKIIQGGVMFGLTSGTSDLSLKSMGIKPLKSIESSDQTGLKHLSGTVSFARDLALSGYVLPDIFICLGDSPQFDANGRTYPDNLGFPAFAQVIEGIDVATKIFGGETNGLTHIDTMRGQMLTNPVRINRATRL